MMINRTIFKSLKGIWRLIRAKSCLMNDKDFLKFLGTLNVFQVQISLLPAPIKQSLRISALGTLTESEIAIFKADEKV